MKIALITLHRVVNYGSVLQAYATQFVLQKMGNLVEVLDYFTERMTIRGMLKRLKTKKKILQNPFLCFLAQAIMLPSYMKRFSVFHGFIRRHLHLSNVTYKCMDDFHQFPPSADLFCTGSDQVWNSGWNEGIDRPFFLDFVSPGSRCISYAASFGKAILEEWEKEETGKLLQKYSHISMREASGVKILNELNIHHGVHVLDPTLLLSFDDWAPIISPKYEGKKYILLYNLNRNPVIESFAMKLSERKELPIYSISYVYHEVFRKGKLIVCPSPEDFLSLIANASYVLTDSFHATAFSSNFSRNLVVFYPENFSTRLESLINLLRLESHVADSLSDIAIADIPLDVETVQTKLAEQRALSISYLRNAVKG